MSAASHQSLIQSWRPRRLAEACSRGGVQAAAFGSLTASGRHGGEWHEAADTDALRVPALCAVKLFTSLLVCRLGERHSFSLETPASTVLARLGGASRRALGETLEGVTLADLLAHTHGLGADLSGSAPRDARGFIDARSVASTLRGKARLFEPGRYFSYGALGYVCLGILVETLCGKPFAYVLQDEVLRHLAGANRPAGDLAVRTGEGAARVDGGGPATCNGGVGVGASGRAPLCPASGEDLTLSLGEWLEFARCFVFPPGPLAGHTAAALRPMLQPRVAMPGWSPHVLAGGLGWRDFGGGWYGHNGIGADTLCWFRINPARGIGLCLLARDKPADRVGRRTRSQCRAALLPALLVSDDYPELLGLPGTPPAIRNGEDTQSDAEASGHYRGALGNIVIERRQDALWMKITEDHGAASVPVHETALYAAEREVFYLARPWRTMAFVQTVRGQDDERFLWDHERLWRKE